MKVRLRITKKGKQLYENEYEVGDADDFGRSCSDAWRQLQEIQLRKETSIGALMENINKNVLELLNGASITVTKP